MENNTYRLEIRADGFSCDDPEFSVEDVWHGDTKTPVDVYFEDSDGNRNYRNHRKRERRMTNQTLPRLAFQVFESKIFELSDDEMAEFPICQYGENPVIQGIFRSEQDFRTGVRNTMEFMSYVTHDGRERYIYCWNIFTTLLFVQECLKRFGDAGDRFVLHYRPKPPKDTQHESDVLHEPSLDAAKPEKLGFKNRYSQALFDSKNIIFRGAPGTGKSYLAKQLAADIVSRGAKQDYGDLDPQELEQIDFVQFHPGYDYSDFVEGLRPALSEDGSLGFTLQDGIFKKFVTRARDNQTRAAKSSYELTREASADRKIAHYLNSLEFGVTALNTRNANPFFITDVSSQYIDITIPGNLTSNRVRVKISELKRLLEAGEQFSTVTAASTFLGRLNKTQADSYLFILYENIRNQAPEPVEQEIRETAEKSYVFIIDEINRGEISKIFGELFFAIDPGYRGVLGEVTTQYSSMNEDAEKFYIPDNVYIIGTMNDIDRSVDSFDFAMRRRFRFIEITADSQMGMLDILDDSDVREQAKRRLRALNAEIETTEELNRNYQIGPAYMLKAQDVGFERLWTDYLEPLLADYVRGLYNEAELMERYRAVYNLAGQEAGYDQG